MEIDIREVDESARSQRALSAVSELGKGEILTLLMAEEPLSLIESLKNVYGDGVDVQKVRWGLGDLPWILHVKRSLKPSAYHPEEG